MKTLYNFISDLLKNFWSYLGDSQGKFLRILHALIAMLIILQIIDSNFTEVNYHNITLGIGTWFHIIVGFSIAVLFVIFLGYEYIKRGIKYFYPYLFGDFRQLKLDICTLLKLKLPNAKPGGLAAIVQGLGLLALLLVLASGISWFIAWNKHSILTHSLQSLHESFTTLIEIYIIAHGAVGVLHFLLKQYLPQRLAN